MTKSTEVDLTEIKEYIWTKYVDLEDPETALDETEILRIFETHYSETPLESDKESFYYGIILFEQGWNDEENREKFFYTALKILNLYRELSGETDWEPVEDRLEDLRGYFEDEGIEVEVLEEKYGEVRKEPPEITRFREACPPGMTLVPGGEYVVGPDGQTVVLEPFYIDVLPVTNEEFGKFIDMTKYRTPKYWGEEQFNRPTQPVVGVSFFDAMKYAQWAGKEIPSHEQWMAAARGEERRAYPWGDDFDDKIVVWSGTNDRQELSDAGRFPENSSPTGCLDMAGNVWEWTVSWYDEDRQYRIIKGGSFADPADLLKCETILWASSKEKIDILGFRCCKPCKGVR
jgi:serine/threonine-protein kinase